MSLDALAAGLVIKVKDQASAGAQKIGAAFGRLETIGNKTKGAILSLNPVLQQTALIGGAVALGVGFMGKKALDFEAQMSVVRSISSATKEDFDDLTKVVKRLGATTQFSATQAGEGAQYLTQAGFTAKETIAALPSVLDAAAAGGLELGRAASLVGDNLRAFGLDASEAQRIADGLARTANSTNTDMVGLGDGLKFVAPKARELGVNFEETSFSLGLMANAGLRGTVGGTALKNMFIALVKPTKQATAAMQKYGFHAKVDAETGNLHMVKTMEEMARVAKDIKDPLERAAFFTAAFGIRGGTAASTLGSAFADLGGITKDGTSKFEELAKSIGGAGKSAKEMAEERLNNLNGAFTLLKSAAEGASIEIFTQGLAPASDLIRLVADNVALFALTLQDIDNVLAGNTNPEIQALREKLGPLSSGAHMVAMGVHEAFQVFRRVREFLAPLEETLARIFFTKGPVVKSIAKWITILAPIAIVLGGIAGAALLVLPPLVAIAGVIGSVLEVGAAAFGGLVLAAGLFGAAVETNRQEGQSWMDSMIDIFNGVKEFAIDFYEGIVSGYQDYVEPSFSSITQAGEDLWNAVAPIFDQLAASFEGTGSTGMTMAETIMGAIGFIAEILSWLISNVVSPVISFWTNNFVAPWLSGVADIVTAFQDIFSGATSLKEGLWRVFTGLAKSLATLMLTPLKTIISAVKTAAKAIGAEEIAQDLQTALDAMNFKEGFGGEFDSGRPDNVTAKIREGHAKRMTDRAARNASGPPVAIGKRQKTKIDVTAKPPDQRIDIDNKMVVDGKQVAGAGKKARIEQLERLGHVDNPFLDRSVTFQGF